MFTTSSHEFGFSKSLEGVSNGIASMLPCSLDTDDEYDYGPKPSELYGTYTWKISKFSEINKSESRTNVFNVGGYKWEIKDRPFRCLDSQYKSELIRLYRSNVEKICWDFVEDRKERIEMFIEDEARWSRFWSRIDQKPRDHLSRENFKSILPKVVRHLFIEKKDSSALVMESLYSGLKVLKEPSNPIARIEEDTFILVDDVSLLLKREATKPFLLKRCRRSSKWF